MNCPYNMLITMNHRRSIRLKDYDYSQAGAYFITICAHQRECSFGEIVNDQLIPTEIGRIVQDVWNTLPDRYSEIESDAFALMPNHMHGIIVIHDVVGAIHPCPGGQCQGESPLHESPLPPLRDRSERRRMLLPKVVGYFKMNTAKRANQIRLTPGLPLWQRNYYEHIIRCEREWNAIREYINLNPARWVLDRENFINLASSPQTNTVDSYWREAGL